MKKGPCIKGSRKGKKHSCKKHSCKSYSDSSYSDSPYSDSSYSDSPCSDSSYSDSPYSDSSYSGSPHSDSSYSGSPHPGDREEGGLVRAELASELSEHLGEYALFVLNAAQLNILNQVFRPIMCGKIAEVGDEYLVLHNVNIKMSNAPEFIFPTDLIIPLMNIVWFTSPFDCSVRFSLY